MARGPSDRSWLNKAVTGLVDDAMNFLNTLPLSDVSLTRDEVGVLVSSRCEVGYLVLKYDGPVLAVHIATDGIYDEPEARQFTAQYPVREKRTLEALLKREANCDDLAVAWVATRWPGLLGDEEVADA